MFFLNLFFSVFILNLALVILCSLLVCILFLVKIWNMIVVCLSLHLSIYEALNNNWVFYESTLMIETRVQYWRFHDTGLQLVNNKLHASWRKLFTFNTYYIVRFAIEFQHIHTRCFSFATFALFFISQPSWPPTSIFIKKSSMWDRVCVMCICLIFEK